MDNIKLCGLPESDVELATSTFYAFSLLHICSLVWNRERNLPKPSNSAFRALSDAVVIEFPSRSFFPYPRHSDDSARWKTSSMSLQCSNENLKKKSMSTATNYDAFVVFG